MDIGRLLGRSMAFPPQVGPDGRVSWSAGEVNIRESITIILRTERRERVRLPEFGGGLDLFLFEPNTVSTRRLIQDRITKELALWEPRIVVEAVTVEPDPDDRQAAIATITYRLVATQARERVSLTVTLAG
jgi:phage baseplate assembly protein W